MKLTEAQFKGHSSARREEWQRAVLSRLGMSGLYPNWSKFLSAARAELGLFKNNSARNPLPSAIRIEHAYAFGRIFHEGHGAEAVRGLSLLTLLFKLDCCIFYPNATSMWEAKGEEPPSVLPHHEGFESVDGLVDFVEKQREEARTLLRAFGFSIDRFEKSNVDWSSNSGKKSFSIAQTTGNHRDHLTDIGRPRRKPTTFGDGYSEPSA